MIFNENPKITLQAVADQNASSVSLMFFFFKKINK